MVRLPAQRSLPEWRSKEDLRFAGDARSPPADSAAGGTAALSSELETSTKGAVVAGINSEATAPPGKTGPCSPRGRRKSPLGASASSAAAAENVSSSLIPNTGTSHSIEETGEGRRFADIAKTAAAALTAVVCGRMREPNSTEKNQDSNRREVVEKSRDSATESEALLAAL